MSLQTGPDLWLADAVASGQVDTVALSFVDRLGGWRGKRVPARDFVERGSATLGFCDGMIVCDIQCGIIEETPFSNYSTGYPDLHVALNPRNAKPMGWRPREVFVFGVPSDHDGIPLSVAPTAVLDSVIRRLGNQGINVRSCAELSGAFFGRDRRPVRESHADGSENLAWQLLDALVNSWIPVRYSTPGIDPGSFHLGFEFTSPLELAEGVVVAKGAAKELARASGADAIFMTRRPGGGEPALLKLEVTFSPSPSLDIERVDGLLAEARPFLFPSVNAIRQPYEPLVKASDAEDTCWTFTASAEADPFTALATVLSAMGAAMEGVDPSGLLIGDLAQSSALLQHAWLRDWLGVSLLENAVPLFEHEASLFTSYVTDWEIERYWGTA
jgi:glutamine synthetase